MKLTFEIGNREQIPFIAALDIRICTNMYYFEVRLPLNSER